MILKTIWQIAESSDNEFGPQSNLSRVTKTRDSTHSARFIHLFANDFFYTAELCEFNPLNEREIA